MPFLISLDEPKLGKFIRATGSLPAGYVVDAYEHDTKEERVVLVFLKEDPRGPEDSFDHEFAILQTGKGELHTVSALLIAGNKIVASDRKRVRSGRTYP